MADKLTLPEIKLKCLEMAMDQWCTSETTMEDIIAMAEGLYEFCTGDSERPKSYKLN